MAQLPKKISRTTKKPETIKSVGNDSVQDVMVNNTRSKTLATNVSTYKGTIKNNGKRQLENAGSESVKNTAKGFGVSDRSATDLSNIAKYGKKATDSILNLGTKGIDRALGTNTNGILRQLVPDLLPSNTEPASGGLGSANPNSIAARMELRGDPLMSFHWFAQLPELPNLQGFDTSLFSDFVEEARITLPFFESEPVFRNGTFIYYPKFSNAGSLTLTFYENVGLAATTYIQAWLELIQNRETGFYNKPSIYKKPIILTPLDPANIPCGTFYVDGAWPTQLTGHDLISSNSDYVKLSCEFAVNRIYFEVNPKRAEMLANRNLNLGPNNSPSIKKGDLIDILKNPLEFAKQTIGLKSNTNIKF